MEGFNLNSDVKKIIESLLRRAGRFVLGLNKYDSIKLDISERLNWLFPTNIYKYEVLKLTYSIMTKQCPPYFYDYVNFDNLVLKNTRTKQYVNIAEPLTKYGRCSFKYNATLCYPVANEILAPYEECQISVNLFNLKFKKIAHRKSN
jgi:hypothetical protein